MAKLDIGENATARKTNAAHCKDCVCMGCGFAHTGTCLKTSCANTAHCPHCQRPKAPAKPRRSKYNAIKTEYNGVTYDSKKEAKRAVELDYLLKAGEIKNLGRQIKFPVEINGKHVFTYHADFAYETAAGEKVVEDVKGLETTVFKLKAKCIEAYYGFKIIKT